MSIDTSTLSFLLFAAAVIAFKTVIYLLIQYANRERRVFSIACQLRDDSILIFLFAALSAHFLLQLKTTYVFPVIEAGILTAVAGADTKILQKDFSDWFIILFDIVAAVSLGFLDWGMVIAGAQLAFLFLRRGKTNSQVRQDK